MHLYDFVIYHLAGNFTHIRTDTIIDKTDFPGVSLGLSVLILDTMRTEHDSDISDSPVSGSLFPIQIMKLCVGSLLH